MKKLTVLITIVLCFNAQEFEKITYPSIDGLIITADFYKTNNPLNPTVIFFHQSGASRGEYRTIAPLLKAEGFNVLSVDLRWGGTDRWEKIENETARRNGTYKILEDYKKGKRDQVWPTAFASYNDMLASISYLDAHGYSGKRIAVGSSASAIFVLKLDRDRNIDGIASFSPAEYYPEDSTMVQEWAKDIRVPTYFAGGVEEAEMMERIYQNVTPFKSKFISKIGKHGASIMREDPKALSDFLNFLNAFKLPKEVSFTTEDNIEVFADLYFANESKETPFILAFNQGGHNVRAEYGPFVERLILQGFNVITVDQRRGGNRFGGENRTVAILGDKEYSYCDAYPDVLASVKYIRDLGFTGKKIVWGSSFSSALVMKAALELKNDVHGVLAFSPSSGTPLKDCLPEMYAFKISQPLIVFRPPTEIHYGSVYKQYLEFKKADINFHILKNGVHGSSALNRHRVEGSVEENWTVVNQFLSQFKN